jgi:DNA-binding beta-propeller fold protein YncE
MKHARLGAVIGILLVGTACGGSGHGAREAASPRGNAASGSCAVAAGTQPLGQPGNSGTVALAKVGGKRVAFVADEDTKAILTLDLDTHAELAQTPVGGVPGHVWIASDGRIFVTVRDKGRLVVLGASRADAALTKACETATSGEPIAIAPTPDESKVLVTTGFTHRLAAYDTKTLAKAFETSLAREPRSVVVSDDAKTAFVSHAVGSVMSAVDLGSPKHEEKLIAMRGMNAGDRMERLRLKMVTKAKAQTPAMARLAAQLEGEAKKREAGRPTCQGFALAKSAVTPGRIFAPQVAVDPGDLEARPDGYGDANAPTEAPSIAVLDEGTGAPMPSSTTMVEDAFAGRSEPRNDRPECLLPRAAAIDSSTNSLLVTCYGIDAVVAYDASSATPLAAERRRWTVGSGPSGVAIDDTTHKAVVWSQFDRSITSFDIGGASDLLTKTPKVQTTRLSAPKEKLPAEYALGRILFHAAGDGRISSDGRACASCHPDGRDDGITWATPEGPRRSITLAGKLTRTAPYSWNGNETSLHGHLANTFDRLSGKGLRSIELDALVAFISGMPAPEPTTDGLDAAKVARGNQIFHSSEAACSTCHSGTTFTDGRNHDVGSKHAADRATTFNTPSLHLVGSAGPYFHDGRYKTLNELLVKSDGKMGHTKHLSNGDIDALETFLRTL